MKNTGLALRPVLASSLIHARPESPGDLDSSIVRTQEVSQYSLCRPSDVHPEQLKAAAVGKQDGCSPLVAAIGHYSDRGWTVNVFPWVVGISGLVDPSHIHTLLDFLDTTK